MKGGCKPSGMACRSTQAWLGCCGNVMEPLDHPSKNHRSTEAVKGDEILKNGPKRQEF